MLYRYFYDLVDPFRNYTELGFCSEKEYINYFYKKKIPCPKSYDEAYFKKRIKTEKDLRSLFVQKGGVPQTCHPVYMVLGNCDYWFYKRKRCLGALAISVNEFDPKAVSFTYGDSIPTFDKKFDRNQSYHHNVYTVETIFDIIKDYGYPQQWNPDGKHGYETYIEAQIWTNIPIKYYRPIYAMENEDNLKNHCYRVAKAVIEASPHIKCILSEKYELFHILDQLKQKLYWSILNQKVRQVDKTLYMNDVVHGFEHCLHCTIYIFILGHMWNVSERMMRILINAALFHDIGRIQNDGGSDHGQVAAQSLSYLISDLSDCDRRIVQAAVHAHCLKDSAVNNIISLYTLNENMEDCKFVMMLLKDVDSLDYIRLGVSDYSTKFLHYKETYKLIPCAVELNLLYYRYKSCYDRQMDMLFR